MVKLNGETVEFEWNTQDLTAFKGTGIEPRSDCRVWTPGPFLKCLAAVRKKRVFDGRVTMIP